MTSYLLRNPKEAKWEECRVIGDTYGLEFRAFLGAFKLQNVGLKD